MNILGFVVVIFMNFGFTTFMYLLGESIHKLLSPKNLEDTEEALKNLIIALFFFCSSTLIALFTSKGVIEEINKAQDTPVIVQIEDNTK